MHFIIIIIIIIIIERRQIRAKLVEECAFLLSLMPTWLGYYYYYYYYYYTLTFYLNTFVWHPTKNTFVWYPTKNVYLYWHPKKPQQQHKTNNNNNKNQTKQSHFRIIIPIKRVPTSYIVKPGDTILNL